MPKRDTEDFISHWSKAELSENQISQPFLVELCDLLDVPQPDNRRNGSYTFEFHVSEPQHDGTTKEGRIDLYKRGSFVLESKKFQEKVTEQSQLELAAEKIGAAARRKKSAAPVRNTERWDDAMLKALVQAERYTRALPTDEPYPPFVLVVDIGNVIEVRADFSLTGRAYQPFPDPLTYRIRLDQLRDEKIRQRLKLIWTNPLELDPSRRSAEVTREVAKHLAELAKSFEKEGHAPKIVAEFLTRCLFCMFAEDVGLLPDADGKRGFTALLHRLPANGEGFVEMLRTLFKEMNEGRKDEISVILRHKLLKFNGGLFVDNTVLSVNGTQLGILKKAAELDWQHVEPAIFGTLLERALGGEGERRILGAHFTPRAYVERLVLPTVVEPLRAEWENVRAAAVALGKRGDIEGARKEINRFHQRLCEVKVLDPACGSGNFLYVALEYLKRLEGEILDFGKEFGEGFKLEMETVTVDPHQFLGLEINPRAVSIAELVLWIGYLQWHFRTRGQTPPREPVLKKFDNIQRRDAVLAYDGEPQPAHDTGGTEIFVWDRRSKKTDMVTGREVPDESKRVRLFTYTNPRPATWPDADFIVGNPPFSGDKLMREKLGDGYVEALRKTYPEIAESANFVMYWWHKAAELVRAGNAKRFGLITTNAISQTFNRRVVQTQLSAQPPLSLTFAIPDHPWVDTADGAAVRIAMTVGVLGEGAGDLLQVSNEEPQDDGSAKVTFTTQRGRIQADISIGASVATMRSLNANELLNSNGMMLAGSGFIVTNDEAAALGLGKIKGVDNHRGWLQKRQNQLDSYRQAGLVDTSRKVTSETLEIMGLGWMLQTAYADRLSYGQLNVLPEYVHRLGRMAQEGGKGYYVDVYMQESGGFANSGTDTNSVNNQNTAFDLSSYFWSALEHGIIEGLQSSNLLAASTVKMLEIANTNHQAVYLVNNANWSAVQGSLKGYDLNYLGNFIGLGYYLLLPQVGTNSVAGGGTWKGYGIAARLQNGSYENMEMLIGGGYNGGYVDLSGATVNPPYVNQSSDSQPLSFTTASPFTFDPSAADPVDMANGTFQVEHTDLTLGGAEPRGITLSRYYNGTRRFSNPSGMADGWLNNYTVNTVSTPAPQAGLGGTTPAQAAPMLAATAAALAIYNGSQPDAKNWTVTALIAKWGIDQLTKGGVSVNMGKDTVQFVKQPNGIYTPPANCTMTLIQTNSIYWLQQRHGNTFKFNTAGLLTNIVDQYSQPLTITYNASNWVSTVKDWKGRQFTFSYTGTPARLTSVSDNSTPSRTNSYGYSTAYNSQGDLTSFTDAEGKTSTYAYDGSHDVTATFDALNRLVVSNNVDSLGHVTTQLTDGDPNQTWQIFWSGWRTIAQDPAGGQQNYFYDDQTRLIGTADALGNLTQTFYDGQDHVVMTISPLNETNLFGYDGNNNLTNSTDPLGFTNQFVYDNQNNLIRSVDPRGNLTTFGYNTQFSLTGQTNGAGDFVNYSYNSDGTLHTRTDSGGTTTNGYDSYGQVNSIGYPNGLGSESFVNSSLGEVTSHTDARGFITTFQYNNRQELTNTIAPTNLTNSVSYDPADNVASTTDARRNSTTNTWSATRHLLTTTLPTVAAGTPVLTSVYDNRDWLARSLDPLQAATLYTNNPAGWLVSQTDPLQRTTVFGCDADGRQIAITNAAQEVTRQAWDARGKLIALTDGAQHTSLRAYDGAGNQVILTNRNGKVWQFQFDGANRLTNTITPLPRHMSQTWNHQGLLSSSTDPSNQPTYFYYDGKGRLTNRTDNTGTTLYRLDADDNVTNVSENGLTNSWTFDAYNRVSAYKDAYGNLIQYHFDANGNLTNLVYPGAKNVYYTFDADNHLTQVKDWSGRITTLTYDLAGRITTLTRPNGTFRTLSYDSAGELTNIWEQMANGLPIAWLRHNWNPNTTMNWEFAAPLPHTNAPASRTMTYNDDNELKTVDNLPVTVDSDGNLTYGPLTNDTFSAYTFDARNRLLNAGGVTNVYDAMNNRIGQTCGTNSIVYVVNPNAKLPQVLMRIKNGVTNYYIYGAGLLYQVTETATGTNTLTYHYDSRGSTVALTADNGLVVDRFEYSLYATLTYCAGTDDTPFLFNGRFGVMTDPNGLLYMCSRYYNPYLCRFLNPDAAGFAGGLNFYAYANGNPVSYEDPMGLFVAANSMDYYTSGAAADPYNLQFQAKMGATMVAGEVVGAAGATVVAAGATALVSAGVSQSVVTGGLLVTGGAGIVASGYSIYENPSPNNIVFNAASLEGGFIVGGMTGKAVDSALSPANQQPTGPVSLSSEVSMAWRDSNGNINPLAFLSDWLLPGAQVGPMSTGPSTIGAASTVGGTGAGIGAGLSLWAGQSSVDWLGNPVSSSSTGKVQ